MGSLCSKGQPVAQEEDEERERELTRQLKQEDRIEKNVYKLLLLGSGESGKSTIFKQIKLLYNTGFGVEELKNYTPVIHANVYQAIKILYEGCLDLQKKDVSGEYTMRRENMEHGKRIAEIGDGVDYHPIGLLESDLIAQIWSDPAIQATYRKANELQLPDCTEYFLSGVDRLAKPDYIPTEEDILHARVRTTGIADVVFKHDGHTYRVFDVGGQRNERRKWLHLFDGVKAVIFCAALSEYDQNLFEDEGKNRMVETMELFESVLRHPSFEKTSFLVFLNKYDIFRKKVLSVPLNVCEVFRDYNEVQGDQERKISHALQYIKNKFDEIYKRNTPGLGTQRLCWLFETTALDPRIMKYTFELVDKNLVVSSISLL
ncbi:heterotrimeric G protein, alpha subunit [Selaginella moellendorffii]|uniref:Guanine nucleotide-binding protein alpha subunit n=1 Tax=Selaginella moellendorffii TaxID=88036 RepID=D8QR00_SELML|nr:guanine nucleotide-binding protein alpha-1 subunit [Selaginella moellendorffii]EFJ38535.1 heterotrimeric G protein, alpha subunit [Selaginella moellendorffii]|eukprot:XP_002960996.1 guanine nucleotide-binding protein alpha-1 subunit [Selaginella moellendorffii]